MKVLYLNSWAGRTETPVKILKETPKRFRVELLQDCLKGKKGRVLYVPKYAIGKRD